VQDVAGVALTLALAALAARLGAAAPAPGGPRIAMLSDASGGTLMLAADEIDGYRATTGPQCQKSFTGCPRLIIIDAAKMPFIARNIKTAIAVGKPEVLYRGDPAQRRAKQVAACKNFVKHYPDGSCDEYPFASSQEGGAGAQIAEVPVREQNCQGGTISGQYQAKQIAVGMPYLVVVTNSDKIARGPYIGDDIAENKGAC
jgi:hypothetical protein